MNEIPYPFKDKEMIFGILFNMSSKLQKLMDRELNRFDITSKQWYMTIILKYFFHEPPTLNELAETMELSHQNVKQIASKLVNKGFMRMERDKQDQRALRLALTEKSDLFWKEQDTHAEEFINALYEGLTNEELAHASKVLQTITKNLNNIESENEEEK